MDIGEYLSQKSKECARLENVFLYTSEVFYFIAIISSSAATIMGALSTEEFAVPKIAVAVAAAIPGLFIAFDNRFRLRARSDWNAVYKVRYQALLRQLEIEGTPAKEVSALLSQLEEEMEKQYPVRSDSLTPLS
ncbi:MULTISPECIES: hypothetical protein [unclassified Caballeronia]|uniref:hypothetical protein n=1 Tax=unclassified Caballeronia TaxID=2646786 RepID=UPI002866128B|nr:MULTISPECIES: hypothetical protein [unclassified Caballeronia]MDR5754893.1 hypothetical protein [Caballeronia sp. LZ024]MDR5845452.1 hypothetical protein [Caballeronia sp. LZ031]